VRLDAKDEPRLKWPKSPHRSRGHRPFALRASICNDVSTANAGPGGGSPSDGGIDPRRARDGILPPATDRMFFETGWRSGATWDNLAASKSPPESNMASPIPTPTRLKILRGNPGCRPIRPEPLPTRLEAIPEPPSHLSPIAQEEWRRIVPQLVNLGLLTVVDLFPLAAYCKSCGRWVQAEQALQRMADNDPVTRGLVVKVRSAAIRCRTRW
jgi:phage terminase small subunit